MRVLCQSIQNRAINFNLDLHKPPSVPLARGVVLLKRVYYSEKPCGWSRNYPFCWKYARQKVLCWLHRQKTSFLQPVDFKENLMELLVSKRYYTRAQWPIKLELIPVSVPWSYYEYYYPPPPPPHRMVVHCKVTPSISSGFLDNLPVSIYTPGWRQARHFPLVVTCYELKTNPREGILQ